MPTNLSLGPQNTYNGYPLAVGESNLGFPDVAFLFPELFSHHISYNCDRGYDLRTATGL